MPRIVPVEMDPFRVTLEMDALYLNAARQALARAKDARRKVARARLDLILLEREEGEFRRAAESGSSEAWDALHALAIQIVDGAQPALGLAYAPYLQDLAVVHISAVAAVEAHLNSLGKGALGRTRYRSFERLGIPAKWLFLPSLAGGKSLEESDHRFKMLSTAVRFRNELVHYKTRQEDWREGRPPRFLAKLGLQIGAARRSVEAAGLAIEAVSQSMGNKVPYWIDRGTVSYFELVREGPLVERHSTREG